MGRRFEKVERVKDIDFELPTRATAAAAGYDFINPETVILEPRKIYYVKTGVKAFMQDDEFLMLCNRSSNPKKKNLVLINGVGIIDADYYNNPDNEGEIAFAFENISDEPITIEAGEKLGQGIFTSFYVTDEDNTVTSRSGGFGSTGA